MHVLHYKMKSLKPKLQVWNKTVVGNFHNRVHLAQQQLSEAQLATDQLGYSMDRSQLELDCLTRYSQALNLLNSFWQEKSKNISFWREIGTQHTFIGKLKSGRLRDISASSRMGRRF